MSKQAKESIKSAQLQLRQLNFKVEGADGSPSISGFDQFNIDSVVDNGVGDYTIIFKFPFKRAPQLAGWGSLTALVAYLKIEAIAYDRINVKLFDTANAAIDGDIFLCVVGSDFRYNIQ